MNLRSVAAVRPPASAHGWPENVAVTKTSEAVVVSRALDGAPSKTPDANMFRTPSGAAPQSSDGAPQLRIVRDELSLSRPLRSHREGRVPATGLNRTFRSLIATSQLGDERVSEVQTRMRDGYYAQPDVTMEVAGMLGKVLAMGA